jgi:hypothetical protein
MTPMYAEGAESRREDQMMKSVEFLGVTPRRLRFIRISLSA